MENSVIVSGNYSKYFLDRIKDNLFGYSGVDVRIDIFKDEEFCVEYSDSIRGKDVFIIQSIVQPERNLMEILLMIDAAKRSSAKQVIVVAPYLGWSRQDRKSKPRVPITAKLIADMLTVAGMTRLITMDMHAGQIQAFYNVPVDHLYGSYFFVPQIKKDPEIIELSNGLKDLMIVSPDEGSVKRAHGYAKSFGCGLAICYKERTNPNEIDKMELLGKVKGKVCILPDDILDTAGTICKASELIMTEGKAKAVFACITHPLCSGKYLENIENSYLTKVFVSDSLKLKTTSPKFEVVSSTPLFAEAINRTYHNQSIDSLFHNKK